MKSDISRKSKVNFKDNPYCKLYNKGTGKGLGIIRPTYDSIHLDKLDKTSVTVIAPFFDDCEDYDRVESVVEEYINMRHQEISIKT